MFINMQDAMNSVVGRADQTIHRSEQRGRVDMVNFHG